MRVAHFIHRYPPALGGAEAYFARLSRYLVAQGDEVTVFTSTADALPAFWDRSARQFRPGETWLDGVRVRRFRLLHVPLAHRYVFKALSLLPLPRWQALTMPANPITPEMLNIEGRFDLVHATAFPYSFPLACGRRLADRLGVPFVLTPFLHLGNPDDPLDRTRRAYTRPALLELARRADALFVQTEGERDVFVGRKVAPSRIIVQGLGVEPGECTGGDRLRVRQAWDVGDAVVIGHLANNSIEKGTVDLLRAAQRVWAKGSRCVVVLAGPRMPNFDAFWQRFRPAGEVRLLGVLDAQQKRDFFAGIDVFALPSRSDSFGLVLPEAWANGVPCVVVRAGGLPWVVRDGVDGIVTPCGNLDALADGLMRLEGDAASRHRMGAAGAARIVTEFDWDSKLRLVRDTCVRLVAQREEKANVHV